MYLDVGDRGGGGGGGGKEEEGCRGEERDREGGYMGGYIYLSFSFLCHRP